MFKVLIALDGSPIAEDALTLASTLLAGKDTTITLLHVIPRHLIYGKGGPIVAECYDPAAEQMASTALLDAAATRLHEAGLGPTISEEIEVGDPADAILQVAALADADLIVLGSRGLNAAQRFLLGSVSTKVATHAACAVLVAHPKVTAEPVPVAAQDEAAVAPA